MRAVLLIVTKFLKWLLDVENVYLLSQEPFNKKWELEFNLLKKMVVEK